MQKERGTYSSTDLCDECAKPLRECNCTCIKHLCCGGARDYEGHLTDCSGDWLSKLSTALKQTA